MSSLLARPSFRTEMQWRVVVLIGMAVAADLAGVLGGLVVRADIPALNAASHMAGLPARDRRGAPLRGLRVDAPVPIFQ